MVPEFLMVTETENVEPAVILLGIVLETQAASRYGVGVAVGTGPPSAQQSSEQVEPLGQLKFPVPHLFQVSAQDQFSRGISGAQYEGVLQEKLPAITGGKLKKSGARKKTNKITFNNPFLFSILIQINMAGDRLLAQTISAHEQNFLSLM
jgi:hypothetical protein